MEREAGAPAVLVVVVGAERGVLADHVAEADGEFTVRVATDVHEHVVAQGQVAAFQAQAQLAGQVRAQLGPDQGQQVVHADFRLPAKVAVIFRRAAVAALGIGCRTQCFVVPGVVADEAGPELPLVEVVQQVAGELELDLAPLPGGECRKILALRHAVVHE